MMSARSWWDAATRRGGKARRAGTLAAAMVGMGLLAAGCSSGSSSPGVDAAPSSSASASASPSATVSGATEALEYSECMRSHGVSNFPDPTVENGSVGFNITASDGIDQNSPTYLAARQACQSLRGGGTSNSVSPATLAKDIKFAQCMRSHGVPSFPDPNKNGGFSGTSQVNPGSATFQNAQSTCMQVSGLGGGSGSSS